jgi:hypothetical protein
MFFNYLFDNLLIISCIFIASNFFLDNIDNILFYSVSNNSPNNAGSSSNTNTDLIPYNNSGTSNNELTTLADEISDAEDLLNNSNSNSDTLVNSNSDTLNNSNSNSDTLVNSNSDISLDGVTLVNSNSYTTLDGVTLVNSNSEILNNEAVMQFLREEKLNEISELYRNQLASNQLTLDDIISIVNALPIADLTSISIHPNVLMIIDSIVALSSRF